MNPQINPDLHHEDGTLSGTSLNILLTTDDEDDRIVYISGNFNEWHTQDKAFEMKKINSGLYHFQFPANFHYPKELLYKFTKGDWSDVEIDQRGNRTENRVCNQHSGVRKEHVQRWRKNWLPFKKNFLPQIKLISD